jgi:transposase
MEILSERCAGLDVQKKHGKVCLSTPGPRHQPHKEIRTYLTTTAGLVQMRAWLSAQGWTHLAMASTGVSWKPIYHLLEGDFEMLVVHAHHLKTVPGRKTAVQDAAWIADLLQHGLLRASFIPAAPQRELRDRTRDRTRLVEERAREVKRLQKTLEETNLNLGDVVSDVLGKAARMILCALGEGVSDPARLAACALGRVQASEQELVAALTGSVSAHHRFRLGEHLTQIAQLDTAIERVTRQLGRRFTPPDPHTEQPSAPQPLTAVPSPSQDTNTISEEPALTWAEAVTFLSSMPGVSERAAQGILAEIGLDMQQFHTAQHLASWAGVCPGTHERAGKRLSGKARKGHPWVRRLLLQCASGASRSTHSYLAAQYRRIASRRGAKRAAMAVAQSILVISSHLWRERTSSRELGETYFEARNRQTLAKQLVRRLSRLGYQVQLRPWSQAG